MQSPQNSYWEELIAGADPDPSGAIGNTPSASVAATPHRASLAVTSSSSYLIVSHAEGALSTGTWDAEADADCAPPAVADDVIGEETRAADAREEAAARRTSRTEVASPAHDVRKRSFDRAILTQQVESISVPRALGSVLRTITMEREASNLSITRYLYCKYQQICYVNPI